MAQPISLQLTQAAATLLCGVALGMVYDLFRVLRRHGSSVLCVIYDGLFCLCAAAALFLLGLGPGRGELRLYMFPLSFLGGLMSCSLFGSYIRAFTEHLWCLGHKLALLALSPLKKCAKYAKNFGKILKKPFSCQKKWFTIILDHIIGKLARNRVLPKTPVEETSDEAEEIQHLYPDRDSGTDRIRRRQH